jgi:hypothetical protein
MKKMLITISFIFISLSLFSQEKIKIIGKVGYAGIENGKQDGIISGFNVGYLLKKKTTLFIGITHLRNNIFPNKNGVIETGTHLFSTLPSDNELYNDILQHYSLLLALQSNGVLINYYSFSSISFDFGLEYKLLQNSKNDLSIVFKGVLANQIKRRLFAKEISSTEVTISSTVNNYRGIGFSP